MEIFELILLLLAAVLLSSVLDQIIPRISSPLIQIGLGLLIALFVVSPISFEIDSDLFLVLLIAPLLFYEAKEVDKPALWKNRRVVISLAVALVIVTMLIIGFCVNWLIPSIPLAAAFALGAALGPTDAVAVASLSKEASLTRYQKSVLEGESLINDASGIVSFQFALAAVVTGAFSLFDASLSFLISFFGGILVGVILAFIANFIIKKTREAGLENTTFHVLFEIVLPFVIYLSAYWLGVSGILAVVAAGLIISISPRALGPSISQLNIVSTSVWKVASFALNGVVFVLLGAQLPSTMIDTWEKSSYGDSSLILFIVGITFILLLIRFVWLLVLEFISKRRKTSRTIKKMFQSAAVMTLSGPKGAITLAMMLTIPTFLLNDNGSTAFPERSLLLFLSSGVIILTLLFANFIVPFLAPFKQNGSFQSAEERTTMITILRNVVDELTTQENDENRLATQAVIRSYNGRIAHIKENRHINDDSDSELRMKVLSWEQEYLLSLVDKDEVDYSDVYQYLNRLARIQNLIKHKNDKHWSLHTFLVRMTQQARDFKQRLSRLSKKHQTGENYENLYKAQIKTLEYIIEKLKDEKEKSGSDTEDINTLIFEYQQILERVRSSRPSISPFARNTQEIVDITRIGLNLELEQIQSMYDNDSISRLFAKRLRENVYLMQIDLENRI